MNNRFVLDFFKCASPIFLGYDAPPLTEPMRAELPKLTPPVCLGMLKIALRCIGGLLRPASLETG